MILTSYTRVNAHMDTQQTRSTTPSIAVDTDVIPLVGAWSWSGKAFCLVLVVYIVVRFVGDYVPWHRRHITKGVLLHSGRAASSHGGVGVSVLELAEDMFYIPGGEIESP